MVTIVDYAVRQAKEDGREFIVLVLQGGLSLVQSKNTGNFYATVKQTSILPRSMRLLPKVLLVKNFREMFSA